MTKDELKAFVQGMTVNGGITVNGVFGGTEMMEQTVLWEGKLNSNGATANLNNDINNYDAVVVTSGTGASGYVRSYAFIVNSQYNVGTSEAHTLTSYQNTSYYHWFDFCFPSATQIKVNYCIIRGWETGICKVIGLKFVSRITYSTEEQCIGTYLGKPYYIKTIILDNLNMRNSSYDVVINSTFDIVKFDGQYWIGDNWIPINFWMNTGNYVRTFASLGKVYLYVTGWTISKARINIGYTKTTD